MDFIFAKGQELNSRLFFILVELSKNSTWNGVFRELDVGSGFFVIIRVGNVDFIFILLSTPIILVNGFCCLQRLMA